MGLSQNLSVKRINGEVFILDRKNSRVHTFNRTGNVIWDGVEAGKDIDGVADSVAQTFDVSKEEARIDVEHFLLACRQNGLWE